MPRIIIQELERDEESTTDLWAVIEISSERIGFMVQFELELLLRDWDVRKVQSIDYRQRFEQWKKIADNNKFDFEAANGAYIPN